MRTRIAFTLAALCVVTACKGPEGPVGPQGATGPAGPTGPTGAAGASPHMFSGVANSSGQVQVALPVAAGTDATKPPSMTCFLAQTPSAGQWETVADGWSDTTPFCALVFSTTNGTWNALGLQVPPTWTMAFSVIY